MTASSGCSCVYDFLNYKLYFSSQLADFNSPCWQERFFTPIKNPRFGGQVTFEVCDFYVFILYFIQKFAVYRNVLFSTFTNVSSSFPSELLEYDFFEHTIYSCYEMFRKVWYCVTFSCYVLPMWFFLNWV